MSIDLSQFHQIFYEESFEGLDVMESSLLELDCENVDKEMINTIFRSAHSIKGSSGTFGFTDITEFTHVLETLLDQIREGSRRITQEHIDLLLKSVDCLRGLLHSLQNMEEAELGESKELISLFNAILDGDDKPNTSNAPASTNSPGKTSEIEGDPGSLTVWSVRFIPDENMLRTGNEPVRMFRELAELGDLTSEAIVSKVPDIVGLNPELCYLGWVLTLTSEQPKERITEIFEWVIDDAEISITEVAGLFGDMEIEVAEVDADVEPEDVASAPTKITEDTLQVPDIVEEKTAVVKAPSAKDGSIRSNETSSIRVGTDKIDNLVNLVGELVITQSMLGQLGTEFDASKLAKLQEGLAQLEHNTRELQESVMRIRMLPISFTFSRFPRMVRDLSRQLGKKVDIKLIGEQTELDKTVMEKIGDPMVHLVRNSLDHGLETPEERIEAGKPEMGLITLNAYHQGGSITIEIMDDGRGLNRKKIIAKAIKNGLIGENDTLNDDQINDLLFQPGFSTADKVTDVSGRGVGMDVVRRNIQSLNGTIEVFSEEGIGSKFTIRLPLTLAILDGQLIQLGAQTYIIPLISILESLQADARLINHVAGGCDVLRLREDYLPIIRLWEIFGVEPVSKDISDSLLVVLESGNEKIALVVDDLLGQQQVVIKSMESNYKKVEGISGATILGDGTVSLILDITDIIKMAGVHHRQVKKVAHGKFGGHKAA